MKHAIFLALGLLALGCEKHDSTGAEVDSKAASSAAPASSAPRADSDNTGKNERDRSGATLTPGDQGGSEADRTVTQQVRQGVVADDGLSITGKNVKIITRDGVVTLRGPVKTDQEKATIASIAQHVPGVKRVDNQLETAPN